MTQQNETYNSDIKCSRMLENKMQCPRKASVARDDDPTNREALCSVCYALDNFPAGYNRQVGRADVNNPPA
jgi:hypothetical protein